MNDEEPKTEKLGILAWVLYTTYFALKLGIIYIPCKTQKIQKFKKSQKNTFPGNPHTPTLSPPHNSP